jgi:20S proteasome alpha/beta subunit
MTVLVGILCSDGVVIGSDSAATYGPSVQLKTIEHFGAVKVEVFNDSVITACTGSVGLAQRANFVVSELINTGKTAAAVAVSVGVRVSKAVVANFRETEAIQQTHSSNGWGIGMLLALQVSGEPQLIEFDPTLFQPEIKGQRHPTKGDRINRFVSMGSGQLLADPFLAHAYRLLFGEKIPTVAQARLLVAWTIDHVIRYNTGGIGGDIQIAVLQKQEKKWVASYIDAGEVQQQCHDLESYIARYNTPGDGNDPNQNPVNLNQI